MAYIYATITIILCAIVYGCAAWTSAHPDRPLWPPRKFGWRARIVTWTVTILAIGSAYGAGSTSWNAWNWPDWIRWYVGFPLVFIASSVSSYAIVQLGLDQSMGANLGLKTDGLFRLSRNPTYLANITMCLGFVALAASMPALIAAITLAALYAGAIKHEEIWLERTYGVAYSAYKIVTPKWV